MFEYSQLATIKTGLETLWGSLVYQNMILIIPYVAYMLLWFCIRIDSSLHRL